MYIKNFKQLSKKDVNIAGGKGASLGEMTKAGISVPPGFVVLASAFDRFLEETDINVEIDAELAKVNYEDVNSVDKTSMIIRDLIHDAKMPEDLAEEIQSTYKKLKLKAVAVRSSATAEDSSVASWAGELDSFLNTTEKNLLENVKKCWSSLFTPRAIVYRNEKGMVKTKVSVAVVVQEMVQSEVAGITFTVHPVTEDKRQMIIEAAWGLGEIIVSGQVTPDSYVVDKEKMQFIDINVAEQEKMLTRKNPKSEIRNPKQIQNLNDSMNKTVDVPKKNRGRQKLTDKQILELAKICLDIEKHYKKPQDIEWAFCKGKFYVVQSRPITTL